MKIKLGFLFVAAALFLSFNSLLFAQGIKTGEAAPEFSLRDTKGNEVSLASYRGKYVVLEWTNPNCPFVVKHYGSQNMQNLQKEYTGKDVIWLSINSSAPGKQGYLDEKQGDEWLQKAGAAPTALLLDANGKVGKLYNARTTPHLFVIDPDGIVIYQGAIDSIRSFDSKDIPSATNYVKTALDEAWSGKKVSNGSTEPYGCSVKY